MNYYTRISCRVLGCPASDPIHSVSAWTGVCYYKSLPYALGICPDHAPAYENWEWLLTDALDERLPAPRETARPATIPGVAPPSAGAWQEDESCTLPARIPNNRETR